MLDYVLVSTYPVLDYVLVSTYPVLDYVLVSTYPVLDMKGPDNTDKEPVSLGLSIHITSFDHVTHIMVTLK